MPSLYAIKVVLSVTALGCAAIPFLSSAWNYHRASQIKGLPREMVEHRKAAAYEWRGWKIGLTGLALVINSIVDIIP